MASEILFGLLVEVVAEIKVYGVCGTRVNSAVECTLIFPENPKTLCFWVEHYPTNRVVLRFCRNQKRSIVLGVCRKNVKKVS